MLSVLVGVRLSASVVMIWRLLVMNCLMTVWLTLWVLLAMRTSCEARLMGKWQCVGFLVLGTMSVIRLCVRTLSDCCLL